MPKTKSQAIDPVQRLRAFGLCYPGAHTKSPWPGHLDLAVDGKTFAFLSADGEPFSISCKLPHSSEAALLLPFVAPTAYGMGKSGWVTAKLEDGQVPPVDVFEGWIDESYRAVAPKTLVRRLTAASSAKTKDVAKTKPAASAKAPPPSAAKARKPGRAAKPMKNKKKAAKLKR
jgi:predicted DNA-binding protein (MmcQ/YjbR family)